MPSQQPVLPRVPLHREARWCMLAEPRQSHCWLVPAAAATMDPRIMCVLVCVCEVRVGWSSSDILGQGCALIASRTPRARAGREERGARRHRRVPHMCADSTSGGWRSSRRRDGISRFVGMHGASRLGARNVRECYYWTVRCMCFMWYTAQRHSHRCCTCCGVLSVVLRERIWFLHC